jgi:hypothetical protein
MKSRRIVVAIRRRRGQEKPYPITKSEVELNRKKIVKNARRFNAVGPSINTFQQVMTAYRQLKKENDWERYDQLLLPLQRVIDDFRRKEGVKSDIIPILFRKGTSQVGPHVISFDYPASIGPDQSDGNAFDIQLWMGVGITPKDLILDFWHEMGHVLDFIRKTHINRRTDFGDDWWVFQGRSLLEVLDSEWQAFILTKKYAMKYYSESAFRSEMKDGLTTYLPTKKMIVIKIPQGVKCLKKIAVPPGVYFAEKFAGGYFIQPPNFRTSDGAHTDRTYKISLDTSFEEIKLPSKYEPFRAAA